jgi:hypothetical protein
MLARKRLAGWQFTVVGKHLTTDEMADLFFAALLKPSHAATAA